MKTLQELVGEAKAAVNCVSADNAREMIASSGNALMVDVREPGEAAEKRVSGFLNIPRGVLEMKIGEQASDPDTPIFLHCATGGRAALAGAALTRMGYRNVNVIDCNCDTLINVMG